MKKRIKYTLRAPISHIGETASTGSYFQTVLTDQGSIPVITGNSIRGQLRDCMAMHLLETINNTDGSPVKVNKDTFNILFSGGNINGVMKEDIEKAKSVREYFPMISLLGGGLGDMIMAGKLLCSFVYPVCIETEEVTGVPSNVSWHSLIDEIEFTRMDDSKDERLGEYLLDATEGKTAKASTQMRYSVQYIAAGTEFVQDIYFLPGITDLELGAFYAGILKWWEIPRMGGMAAKGFGFFDASIDNEVSVNDGHVVATASVIEAVNQYESFLKDNGADYMPILQTKSAKERKNEKGSDKSS